MSPISSTAHPHGVAKHGRKVLNPLVVLKAEAGGMAKAVASNRQNQDPRVLGADLMDPHDTNGHGCKSIGTSPQDQCLLALRVGLHRGKCNQTIVPGMHAHVDPDAA